MLKFDFLRKSYHNENNALIACFKWINGLNCEIFINLFTKKKTLIHRICLEWKCKDSYCYVTMLILFWDIAFLSSTQVCLVYTAVTCTQTWLRHQSLFIHKSSNTFFCGYFNGPKDSQMFMKVSKLTFPFYTYSMITY